MQRPFTQSMAPTVLIRVLLKALAKQPLSYIAREGYDLVLAARQPDRCQP